jgi:hypothetical protein
MATFELSHLDFSDSLLITIPYKRWDFEDLPRQFSPLFALRRQGPQFESAWGHCLKVLIRGCAALFFARQLWCDVSRHR